MELLKRGKNFTIDDKDILIDIVMKYKDVIENKKTDATCNKSKNKCWDLITMEFNNQTGSSRNVRELKELYSNIKRKARKHLYLDKVSNVGFKYSTLYQESTTLKYEIIE